MLPSPQGCYAVLAEHLPVLSRALAPISQAALASGKPALVSPTVQREYTALASAKGHRQSWKSSNSALSIPNTQQLRYSSQQRNLPGPGRKLPLGDLFIAGGACWYGYHVSQEQVKVENEGKEAPLQFETRLDQWKRDFWIDDTYYFVAKVLRVNKTQTQLLADTLMIDDISAMQMWHAEPELLELHRTELQARLINIGNCFPSDPKGVARAAPVLLTFAPEELNQRLSTACQLLGISISELQEMAWTAPKRLKMVLQKDQVEELLKCLPELLGLSVAAARHVVATDSVLTALGREGYTSRIKKLAEVLGVSSQQLATLVLQIPDWILQDPQEMKKRLDAALQMLQLPPAAAGHLLLRAPKILTRSTLSITWQLDDICRVFKVPKSKAIAIAREVPEFLFPFFYIDGKIRLLAKALEVSEDEAKAMVAENPKLVVPYLLADLRSCLQPDKAAPRQP